MATDIPGTGEAKQRIGVRGWLSIAVFILFNVLAWPAEAVPACAGRVSTDFCNCLMNIENPPPAVGPPLPPPTELAVPLYMCFTDVTMTTDPSDGVQYPRGVIPYVAYKALAYSPLSTMFRDIISAMCALAIILFGLAIYTGMARDVKLETFILLIKIAGIGYFMYNAPSFYLDVYGITPELTDMISGSLQGLRSVATVGGASPSMDNFWNRCNSTVGGGAVIPSNTIQFWAMWDCVFNYLLGFSNFNNNNNVALSGILTLATLFFTTLSTGIVIFFLIIYFVKGLVTLFTRFMMTYILSMLGISFMFIMGYLFIPMILFKYTQTYFEKWLNLCISFLLTPVMMIGYMCMCLVAVDLVAFSGANSIFAKVTQNGNIAPYIYPNSPLPGASINKAPRFMTLLQVDNAKKATLVCAGKPVETAGWLAGATLTATTGTATIKNTPVSTANIGMNYPTVNLTACDENGTDANGNPAPDPSNLVPYGCTPYLSGQRPVPANGLADAYNGGGANTWQYIVGIFTACAVAALLVYVMSGVFNFLPNVVTGLVSQGANVGRLMGAGIAGSGELNKLVNNAYKVAMKAYGRMESAGSKAAGP